MKYIKYAIGEIMLVMIGILLALQVNNWNEIKKVDRFELKLLKELYTSTQRNIQQMKFEIERDSSYKVSCQFILDYFEQNLEYLDSLDEHFSNTIRWRTVFLNYSAYETTKTYGLYHIKNDSIKTYLSIFMNLNRYG